MLGFPLVFHPGWCLSSWARPIEECFEANPSQFDMLVSGQILALTDPPGVCRLRGFRYLLGFPVFLPGYYGQLTSFIQQARWLVVWLKGGQFFPFDQFGPSKIKHLVHHGNIGTVLRVLQDGRFRPEQGHFLAAR